MVLTKVEQSEIKKIVLSAISDFFEQESSLNLLVAKVSDSIIKKIDEKIEVVNKNITLLQEQLENAEEERSKLAVRVGELEQYSRRNCLRVFGIPEARSEDTEKKVLEIFTTKMGINIMPDQIDRCHRVGALSHSNSKKSRAIIIKFVSYKYRQQIFFNKKMLKGTGITIREDLAKSRLELYNEISREYGYKDVWTHDGVIYVNRDSVKYAVRSKNDLHKIPAA